MSVAHLHADSEDPPQPRAGRGLPVRARTRLGARPVQIPPRGPCTETARSDARPLAGVRVLELATVVLGPWACQILGDLGADVVKVEPPSGDSNRQVGPMRTPHMGALFLNCNRNKRSAVIDLKHPRGRETVLRLAARADVLVHNYRPAALALTGPRVRGRARGEPVDRLLRDLRLRARGAVPRPPRL